MMNLAKSPPERWLISDARNDASLDNAIGRMPGGSGFVYRHYHLDESQRARRFASLLPLLRERGFVTIVSSAAETAREWGADGVYGWEDRKPPAGFDWPGSIWIATAHGARELAEANRQGADAVMLSPVFPTLSHPDGRILGAEKFRQLAQTSTIPVIALGGMNEERAHALDWPFWAAIDGLS